MATDSQSPEPATPESTRSELFLSLDDKSGVARAPVTSTAPKAQQTTTDKTLTLPPTDLGPRSLGKYEILEEVAHGGMGVVYKARDPVLDRIVALKVIRSGTLANRDEIQRFLRDARAAAQFNHPHIMPILEIGEHAGQHYFTMPFVTGGSLAQNLSRFVADPRLAVALLEKIARAVHCIHAKDILHRDLKPSNVLLDEQGEPLVSDFGLAKILDDGLELTRSQQRLGTLPYMAPEQISGQNRKVSVRTDVWALGIVLYQLLMARRPFVGESREGLANQILKADPPRSRAGRSLPDRAIEAVVFKCLEKDPERRYPSAEALAEDLRRWFAGETLTVRPPSSFGRIWRVVRRRWNWAIAISLLLAVLAIVLLPGLRPATSPQAGEEPPVDPVDPKLQTIYEELHKGKPVSLVGETGRPRFSKLVEGQLFLGPDESDPLFIGTRELSLLELLPDPQLTEYKFSAEVLHYEDVDRGRVGIYFARSQQPMLQGPVHTFSLLTFNDLKESEPGSQTNYASLDLCLYWNWARPMTPSPGPIHSANFGAKFFKPAGVGQKPTWRKLAVKVTAKGVRCHWGDKSFEQVSHKVFADSAQQLQRRGPNPEKVHPKFGPRGGLGLYVYRSSAWFRSVVIDPMAEQR
jgi:serine/threonine-protein kinase